MNKLHWIAAWCLFAPAALLVSAGPVLAAEPVVSIRNQTVRVDIRGRVATTTVEITYVNYTSRRQEAQLHWRMGPDVAVHDLAMWVDGMRSPAAILTRVKARAIYRAIVSQRRDPALLESLGGGHWRLRVFPILAKGTQKVQFVFSQILPVRDGWVTYRGMRVTSGSTVVEAQDFDFSAVIRCVGGVKDIKAGVHKLGVQRGTDGAVTVGFRGEAFKLSDPVGFSYKPGAGDEGPIIFAPKAGVAYFAATVPPAKLPAGGKARPRNVVVVIDTSESMKGLRASLAATGATTVLNRLRPADRFNMVLVGTAPRMWKDKLVSADKANLAAAIKLIAKQEARGGTDLAAGVRAAESFNTEPGKPFVLYVFSDGMDLVGAGPTTRPAKDKAKAVRKANVQIHWFEIAAGKGLTDAMPLSRRHFIWTITGRKDLEKSLRESLAIADTPVITDIKVACKDAAGKAMPVAISQLRPDLPVTICGAFRRGGVVTATVTYRMDGKPASATYRIPLPQPGKAAGASAALVKVWAHLEGERMFGAMRRNKMTVEDLDALIAHSRKHRVLTRTTAFLVLETDNDYLRRGIDRKTSFLEAGAMLSLRLTTVVIIPPSAIAAKRIASLKAQAKELRRLKRYTGAAEVLEAVVGWDRTQFAASQEAGLLRQFVALQASMARGKDKLSPAEIKSTRELERRRLKRIEALTGRIPKLVGQKQFQEALDLSDYVLRLDPGYRYAREQKILLTQLISKRLEDRQLEGLDDDQRRFIKEQLRIMTVDPRRMMIVNVHELTIPWYAFLGYPDDWSVVTRRREPLNANIDQVASKRLRLKIDGEVEFVRAPFKDAIDFLRNVSGVSMHVKWRALEGVGIDDDVEVKSIKVTGVTVERLLRLVLKDVGGKRKLGFIIDKGVVVISTIADLAKRRTTRVYDIRDLIVRVPEFKSPRISLRTADANADGSLFDDDDDDDDYRTTRDQLGRAIVNLIRETIAPDTWRPDGNIGSITELNGQLVVTQTMANHRRVHDLIGELRKAQRVRIAIGARFIARIAGDKPFPEAMFTKDSHITPWVEQLLVAARARKLSEFSSVRVVKVSLWRHARIGGAWFDVTLSREARVCLVPRSTEAAAALVKAAPHLRALFRTGDAVVMAKWTNSACLGINGTR